MRLKDDATFDHYLPQLATGALIGELLAQPAGSGAAITYLFCGAGSGKSHLLQASCHHAADNAIYLPLSELVHYEPAEVLQGIDALDLVCLDDVDRVLQRDDWELALFDLCNRAREQGCKLLVAGNAAPRALAVNLPELRSRLAWGIVYQMHEAQDEEKIAILQFRAARRGLSLSREVCSYIVTRSVRDTEALLGLLDKLDNASLVEQRALSIPFVKSILGW